PETLRSILTRAIARWGDHLPEVLPPALREKHDWPAAPAALREVHFPTSVQTARQARRRFVYEEFLLLQLALALKRRDLRDRQQAPALQNTQAIDEHIRRLFPFELTRDQNRVIADVCRDLAGNRPMQRLVQADVGA